MSSPETTGHHEVHRSEELRNTAWDYMPIPARTATQGVTVHYWSRVSGNPRVTIMYGPQAHELTITGTERVAQTKAVKPSLYEFRYSRSATLDSSSGAVRAYWEGAETYDRFGKLVMPPLEVGPTLLPLPEYPGDDADWSEAEGYDAARQVVDGENMDIEDQYAQDRLFIDGVYRQTSQTLTQDKLAYLIGLFEGI